MEHYPFKINLNPKIPQDLIYAAFFFIDIVGLSNPVLSTETQRTKIKILNETIYNCKSFRDEWDKKILILPTGDGMLIGFPDGLEQPLKLAIEFHKKIAEYNKNVTSAEKIETRIGCHIGHVFVVKDVLENVNLWGPGAIIARRIMDMGDSNHILLSNDLADDLVEISSNYEKVLNPLHNFGIKHGYDLLIYSAYGEGFGNPVLPKEKIKIKQKTLDSEKNVTCEKIIFNIILKAEPNAVRLERQLYFSNASPEPIYEIIVGVSANSEDEFYDFNLKAIDENGNDLPISQILASTHLSKKIVIKLSKPVFEGDFERMIKITYDGKLTKNNFENFFLIDTSNFELNFSHYSNTKHNPILYYYESENGSKSIIPPNFQTTKGMFTTTKWQKNQSIKLKDLIRLEW